MAGPGSFNKTTGDLIYQADYNVIRNLVASVKTDLYGLSMVSPNLSGTNLATRDQWNLLRQDMLETLSFRPPRIQWITAGNYNFTVTAGITQLTVDVVGAGGGGGGYGNAGDAWSGNGGGSGGYYQGEVISVTPSQVLSITVGAGGAGGSGNAVGIWVCLSSVGETVIGAAGGSSSITGYLTATGGDGAGNNVYPPNSAVIGYGGSPNGVTGQSGTQRGYISLQGGDNGTGYGRGGNGGSDPVGYCGENGQDGLVRIIWSQPVPVVKSVGELIDANDINEYWYVANIINDYKWT